MIQSVYNCDYRNPNKITQSLCKTEGDKLKSHSEQMNSIYNSKLAGKFLNDKKCGKEIDFPSHEREQENLKCEVNGKKVSCFTKIKNRCQNNDDKRLFKSKSTTNGRFCRGPGEMMTTSATKVWRNVTRNDFIVRVVWINLILCSSFKL